MNINKINKIRNIKSIENIKETILKNKKLQKIMVLNYLNNKLSLIYNNENFFYIFTFFFLLK